MKARWNALSPRARYVVIVVAVILIYAAVGRGGSSTPTTTGVTAAPAIAASSPTATVPPAPTTALPTQVASATAAPWQRLQSVEFGGNNPEAASWSRAMCACGPGSNQNSVNYLRIWTELTPAVGGDATGAALIEYRKSVRQVIVWEVFPPAALTDWNKSSAQIKNDYMRSSLNAAHQAPAIVTGPLDNYPDATLVRYSLSTQDGTVVATGEWSSATGVNTINIR